MLLLDEEAMAAIPAMLPPDADVRARALDAIRKLASMAGKPTGEKAQRLLEVGKNILNERGAEQYRSNH